MKTSTLILASAAAALLSTSAIAQTAVGESAAQTRIDDLNENIADDFERDTPQFGNDGRQPGFNGSLAMQASASNGNTDTASVGVGANLGFYDGLNGYDLQLSYTFSEDAGVQTENSTLYELQYTRDLSPQYYGFAKLQGSVDSFPFNTADNFLGIGIGYRIYDTASVQWSVEAGAGYRVGDIDAIEDFKEGALSLSSNYYNQLSDTLAITNDTDIIGSDSDTVVFNDLGVNVAMTDLLALRTSIVTEYHTDPVVGRKDTDNTFGVSLVYNFN